LSFLLPSKTKKFKSVRAKTKKMLFDEKLEGFAEILKKKNHSIRSKIKNFRTVSSRRPWGGVNFEPIL